MQRRLTITLDEAVYDGLHQLVVLDAEFEHVLFIRVEVCASSGREIRGEKHRLVVLVPEMDERHRFVDVRLPDKDSDLLQRLCQLALVNLHCTYFLLC